LLRLTRSVRSDALWQTAEQTWEAARGAIEELRAESAPIMHELGEIVDDEGAEHRAKPLGRNPYGSRESAEAQEAIAGPIGTVEDLFTELVAALLRLGESTERTEAIVASPSADSVCWVSLPGSFAGQGLLAGTGAPTLHLAPLDVAAHIRRWLLDEKASVVFTSATLTTAGSFDYIRGRLGARDASELALGSPFDYERAALVFLPDDVPEPNQPGYARKCAETIADVAEALGGRTLVLFTSHAQLRTTYEIIRDRVDRAQIVLMGQGIDGSRSRLLERFKAADRALLLGTASFWEGVDVVGDALSALVIARLPFAVPTDPVFAARSEEFDDPFGQYAVPQAILRFKQGFGRLIRSQTDRGVVVVLDRRVTSKRYGAAFLSSLPACTIRRAPAALAGTIARDWIGSHEGSVKSAEETLISDAR
jgi:DNA polymerase-3 subunit epsilon/ATP-dependent DNA helicase DinG